MPWSSNATFLATVTAGEACARAIYKPERGERPLWDFPRGLHRREVAAWRLSETLGLDLVPPTVVRDDGPFGEGSLQYFVAADFEQHYFTLHESRPDLHERLQVVCAFDLLANNADRKSGHVLLGLDGAVYGIDHGLCFNAELKLRTVIWEFAGEPVPDGLLEPIATLADEIPADLAAHLDGDEVDALRRRARALVTRPVFPFDRSGNRYPWPMV
jgi:uncharacterized repeat protein (TIGR03843 family)